MVKKRLYPPYIEGKIPAQTGSILAIPFEMNRAVGTNEFKFIRAQIKTVSTNRTIAILDSYNIVDNVAYFNCGESLTPGQFYKIQLAYASAGGPNKIKMFNDDGKIDENYWSIELNKDSSVTEGVANVTYVSELKGKSPVLVVSSGTGDLNKKWSENIWKKDISVTPGKIYTFSGYYANNNNKNYTNKVTAKVVSNNGKILASNSTTFNKANSDWKYFSETFTPSEESISIGFESLKDSRSFGLYDIQLFKGEYNIGYYSTVGIFKYTTMPNILIEGLERSKINPNIQIYQGVYESEDATEKEYSYSFELYNGSEQIYSTGELVHNVNNPVDKFILPINLNLGVRYSLIYTVITSNNLKISKPYYIMDSVLTEIPVSLKGRLSATLNSDEGYISVDLIAASDVGNQDIGGEFRLLRFIGNEYEIIDTFIIQSVLPKDSKTNIYKDFTIAQGVEYRYALQQCSNTVFSQKLYSNYVMADYEDMFLYDGKRQLKLKFNPKVSSFKTFIQESKLDTLGGKYPVFFRNGSTNYKDFPISALISMLSDENEYFYPWKEDAEKDEKGSALTGTTNPIKQTDLISSNLKREREFKLEVLDWLNNGKPKLFRSPTEGNYIVRLMNVNMSPNDTLGRMLHTCNAQAYEIMENTFQNLFNNQLISPVNDIKQITIGEKELEPNEKIQNLNTLHLVVIGNPDTTFKLTFGDGTSEEFVIGNTMIYDVPVQDDNPIFTVENTSAESIRIQYDMSSQLVYPLLFKGQEIFSITQEESSCQCIGKGLEHNILNDIASYDNYNIMALTLSIKMPSDTTGTFADTTVQVAADGTVYTRNAEVVSDEDSYKVIIAYDENETQVTTLDLSKNTLYKDITQAYPNRWKLDSFGNITLTCDAFDDNRFKPTSIRIGNGVYANIYYSTATYNQEEESE